MRILLGNLDEFVWECDGDLRHTFVSKNSARITGRGPEELIGRSILENILPEERAALEERLARLIAEQTPRSGASPPAWLTN